MRMLILLIALAIVGVIVARQLAGPADTPDTAVTDETSVPDVPTKPQELDGFERDMSRFVQDSAAARRERIDQEE